MVHEQFCLLIVARVSSMCPQSFTLSKLEKYGSQTLNRGTARAEYGVEDEHTSSLSTLASGDMVRLWFTCNNGPPTSHLGCKVHVLSTFFCHLQKTNSDFSSQNDVPRQQTSTNPYISTSITTYTGITVDRPRSTYSAVQSTMTSSTYWPLTPKSAKRFQNTLLTHWKTISK